MEVILSSEKSSTYRLHSAISQKMPTLITAAVRTSDPTYEFISHFSLMIEPAYFEHVDLLDLNAKMKERKKSLLYILRKYDGRNLI
jgi:hypothetical protein